MVVRSSISPGGWIPNGLLALVQDGTRDEGTAGLTEDVGA